MGGILSIFSNITELQIRNAALMSKAMAHRRTGVGGSFVTEDILMLGGSLGDENNSERYIIVLDGEIFNEYELKQDILSDDSGSEDDIISILTKLYEKYNTDFINLLRGSFSLLIYDKLTSTLITARDGFGIKPLYYYKTDESIVFASELKAFLFFEDTENFKIDIDQLQHYLTFQYVPEPNTICSDIKILPAGSFMTCSFREERLQTEITEYKRNIFNPNPKVSYDEKKKLLRKSIEDSVEKHIGQEKSIGSFLSSGIDSAIITALASKIKPGIKAFTIGFEDDLNNELKNASDIAKAIDVEHIKLNCNVEDFKESFEKTILYLDGPVADPSTIAIYLITSLVAENVDTVLSGEGADEIFAGYKQYSDSIPTGKIFALPNIIKKGLGFIADIVPDNVKGIGLIKRGITPLEERFIGHSFVFNEEDKKKLLVNYNDKIHFTHLTREIYTKSNSYTNYTRLLKMQDCDLHTWLKGDILVKDDRIAAANSLKIRMPYLDNEVFKIASMLCDNEKLSHSTTKYILRDAFSDIVNAETVIRPKLGYPVPVRMWLRDELYEWARDIIKNSTADEYINKNEAEKLLEMHRSGEYDLYHEIWVLIVFITWYRIYITDADLTRTNISQIK